MPETNSSIATPEFAPDPQSWPLLSVPKHSGFELTPLEPLIRNVVRRPTTAGVLIVTAELGLDDTDAALLNVVRAFAERGQRVTVVSTRYHDDAAVSRARTLRYTHDIHMIAPQLRLQHVPAYLRYLCDTRNIDTVYLGTSEIAWAALPSLFEAGPDMTWIAFVADSGAWAS